MGGCTLQISRMARRKIKIILFERLPCEVVDTMSKGKLVCEIYTSTACVKRTECFEKRSQPNLMHSISQRPGL